MENNFLKNLDSSQMREIVESVYPKHFSTGDYVVREGEAGNFENRDVTYLLYQREYLVFHFNSLQNNPT